MLSCVGGPRPEGGRPSATLRLRLGGGAPALPFVAPQRPPNGGAVAGQPPGDEGSDHPAAEVALRPVTLWLGLPLLARLEAFAEPLLLAAAEAAAAVAQPDSAVDDTRSSGNRNQKVTFETPEQRSSSAHSAVAAAIDSILGDLQVELLVGAGRHIFGLKVAHDVVEQAAVLKPAATSGWLSMPVLGLSLVLRAAASLRLS